MSAPQDVLGGERPAARRVPNPEPHTRIGAYAYALHDDHVLLTQLWDGDVDAGKWSLPGGGIRFGETPVEGLRRELHVETGLVGEVHGVLDVIARVFPPWRGWGPLHAFAIVYAVTAAGQPRVVEVGGSTVDARWFRLQRARALALTHVAAHALGVGEGRAGG